MNKLISRALALVLCSVSLLGMFALPARADGEISSVSVTVTAPAAGQQPATTAAAGDSCYAVESVLWSTDDPFEAGQTYQVQVTLRVAEGYAFAAQVAGTVNGKGCSVETLEPSAKIRLTCDFTVGTPTVSRVFITGLTVPAQGEVPDAALSAGDSSYRIHEVAWTKPDGKTMAAGDRFQSGVYTLRIVLTAAEGYGFADAVTATVDGGSARCAVTGENTAVVEKSYTVESITAITQVALTGLAIPGKDLKPDFSVDVVAGGLYTVEQVAWRGWNTAEGMDNYVTLGPEDTFLPGYSYQVAILLKANQGAAFSLNAQGKPQVTAIINGETAHPGTAVSGKEPAQYLMTGMDFAIEGEKTPISAVEIFEVTEPSIGKKPGALAKVPADALYTVDKVIWKKWNLSQSFSEPVPMTGQETFEANGDYQITVILKAKDEAAFTVDQYGRPQIKATLNENPTNPPAAVEDRDPRQYISVSYNFRTPGELIKDVSILALDEPVKGELPDYEVEVPFNANYEVEDVIWQWRDAQSPAARFSKMTFSDVFGTEKEYRICITLVAREDAEFATAANGQPQVTAKFNGEPAKPASEVKDRNPAQCIQVTFDFLMESDIKKVERVVVEELDMPMAGSKPDMDASVSFVSKFTVQDITWERLDNGKTQQLNKTDTFRAGESYRVIITLKAKENAEFAVSSTGRTNVTATLNGKPVTVSAISGREPKRYISIAAEYSIYTVVEGDGAQWTPKKETLRFRFSGDSEEVIAVKVDDVVLDDSFYTLSGDAVILELDSRYLSALSDGTHRLTVLYENGVATTDFEVSNDGSVPQQEQKKSSGIWILIILLMVVLLCGAVALSVFLRKKGWL